MLKSTFTKAVLVAATSASLLAPAIASAQPYRHRDDYDRREYYCEARRDHNTVGGALVGGVLGSIVGRNVAARGNRHEGAVAGAVGGAVLGGAIGRSSTDCHPYAEDDYRYRRYAYDDGYRYDGGYRRHYDRGYYAYGK
jgi:uncharacterized protein YcfJ